MSVVLPDPVYCPSCRDPVTEADAETQHSVFSCAMCCLTWRISLAQLLETMERRHNPDLHPLALPDTGRDLHPLVLAPLDASEGTMG